MEKLKDIRELEVIPDSSFYIFVIVIVFALALIVSISYMVFRYFRSKKRDLTRKEVLKRLRDIEFDNSKDAAYKITKYARFLANDKKSKHIFSQLENRLLKYKFTPNPPPIDQDTINYYNLFLESIDE